jgi:hypothetical protein
MMKVEQLFLSSEIKPIWMESPIEIEGVSPSLREILDAQLLFDLEGEAFPKVAKFYSPFDELEAARRMEDLIAARAFDGGRIR